MSLIRRKKKPRIIDTLDDFEELRLIPLRKAAALLCLDASTVRKGQAGTEHLLKIRQGTGKRQRVFLLRSEVEAHLHSLVEHARAQKQKPFDLVYGAN